MYLDLFSRPFPIVLVKCWKVGHWNAKKLLKDCQKSKTLLPKFQKLPSKFLDIFILTFNFNSTSTLFKFGNITKDTLGLACS